MQTYPGLCRLTSSLSVCILRSCVSQVRFTDQRLTIQQFLEVKPKWPFGQLPIAKIDGESIAQSSAIARQILEYFTRRIIISFNYLDF